MSIKMAALTPHPPLIIPDIGGSDIKRVQDTVDSLREISGEIVSKDPDVLVTISPHGQVFRDGVSILDFDSVYGDFGDFGAPGVSFQEEIDHELTSYIIEEAEDKEFDIISLSASSGLRSGLSGRKSRQGELDHGVMVPLYYLKEAGLKAPLVPLNMGFLSYNKLYELGYMIQQVLAEKGYEAVVLASGDLSHRLKKGAPAGYNPRGAEFDQLLMELLGDEKYAEILEIDQDLIEDAGECGLRPLVILLGIIKDLNFHSDVKSYEGPFGVGYGVVGFYGEE